MQGIKVPLQEGEIVKKRLIEEKVLHGAYKPLQEGTYIIFPLLKPTQGELVERTFSPIFKQQSFKEQIDALLTKKEKEEFIGSYDVVGSIAIIDVPELLNSKEKAIAELLLNTHKQIRTVLKKASIHQGTFRTQKMEFLAGENTTITEHKEHGVRLQLDVEQVYFSTRSSEERKRIASLITTPERVLVLFSGCAPFPLVIAKHSPAKEVVGIELNPVAHTYALKNKEVNKAKNVQLHLGDVREIIPQLKEKFDRIIMPLPKDADKFLDILPSVSKKGTIIHYYAFLEESKIEEELKKIRKILSDKKITVVYTGKCGQYAMHVYRIVIDFSLN